MEYVVVGVSSTSKTIHKLVPMKRSGRYQLTAPHLTSEERKDENNYTLVDTIEEAVELIRKGYYARMANVQNDQAKDIIANKYIKIFEFP